MSAVRTCDAGHKVNFTNGGGFIHNFRGYIYRLKVTAVPEKSVFEWAGDVNIESVVWSRWRRVPREDESEEALIANVFWDRRAPTEAEVEHYIVTHLPFRVWCPSCVDGRARDRHHWRQNAEDGRLRMKTLLAHVVPRNGLTHEHGAEEMVGRQEAGVFGDESGM